MEVAMMSCAVRVRDRGVFRRAQVVLPVTPSVAIEAVSACTLWQRLRHVVLCCASALSACCSSHHAMGLMIDALVQAKAPRDVCGAALREQLQIVDGQIRDLERQLAALRRERTRAWVSVWKLHPPIISESTEARHQLPKFREMLAKAGQGAKIRRDQEEAARWKEHHWRTVQENTWRADSGSSWSGGSGAESWWTCSSRNNGWSGWTDAAWQAAANASSASMAREAG